MDISFDIELNSGEWKVWHVSSTIAGNLEKPEGKKAIRITVQFNISLQMHCSTFFAEYSLSLCPVRL